MLCSTSQSVISAVRQQSKADLIRLQSERELAAEYRPDGWESFSPERKEAWNKALFEYYDKPFWAVPLPLPPEHDFQADVAQDLKLAAVMCAVALTAKNRGVSIEEQLKAWNYGRGSDD